MHAVETMAYANQVPWHGLGVQVDNDLSAEEMQIAAGLDWSVLRQALLTQGANGLQTVPNKYALVRDSDHAVLSVVSDRYIPVQNTQIFQFFKEYVEQAEATMETAGSLFDGRDIWALAHFGENFALRGDDVVKPYLLLTESHAPGKALRVMFTTVRVVCNNTLNWALAQDGADDVRWYHRSEFTEAKQQDVKTQLGIARDQLAAFRNVAEELQRIQLGVAKVEEITKAVFGNVKEDMQSQPRAVNKVINLFDGAGMGSDLSSAKGTAWGLLNAATEYVDHHKGRTPDTRMNSAWFGQGAREKRNMLDQVIKLAA